MCVLEHVCVYICMCIYMTVQKKVIKIIANTYSLSNDIFLAIILKGVSVDNKGWGEASHF